MMLAKRKFHINYYRGSEKTCNFVKHETVNKLSVMSALVHADMRARKLGLIAIVTDQKEKP